MGQALEAARTCLKDTASHGSTAEERTAVLAWLRTRHGAGCATAIADG
jgi:hypothetical protein